ncbi:MAG: DUF1905 domain-containing protein [Nocardioides sp.]
MESWSFEAELWPHEGGSWVFLTAPIDVDEEIRLVSGPPRGFGSVRVEATIGTSTWRTSVFPSTTEGFVLPVKKAVRTAERIDVGDVVDVTLRLVDD